MLAYRTTHFLLCLTELIGSRSQGLYRIGATSTPDEGLSALSEAAGCHDMNRRSAACVDERGA